ncbi:MAG: DUF192 domain-containing protein, partial [Pseudomonadota bacterium]|nr:DUF192 domain-containing protein [Pseudomonadota bacterium]
ATLPAAAMPFAPCPVATLTLLAGQARACAELARTGPERARGLMFRNGLPADGGMLFVFPANDRHAMWMKNTLIGLSVAFIDEQGRIINIEDMQAQTLDTHAAARPARYALEMPSGWFGRRGLGPGMRIEGLPPAGDAR